MPELEDPAPPDEQLVSAARRGEVRAFEHLLSRYEDGVLRTLRLLGVAPQDREDVAQDVFIRVFRHLDGFRAGRSFRPWLYRVTVNAAHDHRKRMRRRAGGEAPWPEGLERAADAAKGPDRSAQARDLRAALEAALDLLSERERAVFVLRELEGMETREVARALRVTRVTVRRHLGLARRRLQKALEPAPEEKPAMAKKSAVPD